MKDVMGDLYLPESETKVNRLVQPFHLRGGSPIHLRTIEVEFLPWTDRVEALSFHYGTKILSRNAYDENSLFRDSWNG